MFAEKGMMAERKTKGMTAPRRIGRIVAAMSLFAGLVASDGAAIAQSVDCNRLQQQIVALGPPGMGSDPLRAEQFRDAVQRQQSELERTAAYANSIGCGRRQFLFFGDAPPRECGQIEQQISRMRNNLEQLRQQAQQASGDETLRRDLTARYKAACRNPGSSGSMGLIEALFGGRPPLRDAPIDNEFLSPDDGAPGSGSFAVCVRSCDGGFFPVSYSANRSRYQELGELCQAMCPNVETQLFTMAFGREIEQAVAADGRPYTSLPNAGRFRTKFDPACTCKKADQSWSEALANAERMLGRESRRDQIVTPERAAELSRPQQQRNTTRAPAKPDPKAAQRQEQEIAAEAARGAQAPTASRDSAGIAVGGTNSGSNYSLTDGTTREITGPDGTSRRVRTIGPQL
jgi:hypothetical protein